MNDSEAITFIEVHFEQIFNSGTEKLEEILPFKRRIEETLDKLVN